MSEDIYDFLNTTKPSNSKAENIYRPTNEFPTGSRQRTEKGKTKATSRRHYSCYKLAVVLVCVLLLAVTIKLCITILRTKDSQLKDLAEEKDQLQLKYNNMTSEKAQLEQETNAILIHHESQLETNISAVTAERDELQKRLCEKDDMKRIKKHAVNVTLDPDTAHPGLILSADGKQVKHVDTEDNLPDTPKRFDLVVIVLGREGFSSGKFYYEVQVKGKTKWIIGVAKESMNRKGKVTLNPENGFWTIWLRHGTYKANADLPVPLSLNGTLQRVGVFVDYDAGLVSFYDADCWDHIYSFAHISFTEKIYPLFCPSLNAGGKNSAPLIISPVHVCPIK